MIRLNDTNHIDGFIQACGKNTVCGKSDAWLNLPLYTSYGSTEQFYQAIFLFLPLISSMHSLITVVNLLRIY